MCDRCWLSRKPRITWTWIKYLADNPLEDVIQWGWYVDWFPWSQLFSSWQEALTYVLDIYESAK